MAGCPAGANTPESVDLKTDIGPVSSYEVVAAGLEVTPGAGSGSLYGSVSTGMGTSAIGNVLSIESGTPNESIVLQIFRSNGVALGAAEGATDMTLFVGGLPTTIEFQLSAEDKDGTVLGSGPVTTTIGSGTIDVSALFPPGSEIHKLTIEATSGRVSIRGTDYTNVCLGH